MVPRAAATFGHRLVVLLLVLVMMAIAPIAKASDTDREQRDLVDQARMTLDNFMADPNMTWFRDHVKDAKGVFIVPQFLKAAFFVGGAGGSGVFLGKDEKTGEWSEPAFFTMGAGSFGFQFGAQASEVVLLVLTQRGVDSLLSGTFKLGADGSVAVGPVGAGMAGATTPNLSADLLSFVRAKGLFAGVSLEGAVLAARDEWSRDYYGRPVSPRDIVIRREVKNPHSEHLRALLLKAGEK
ncbi:lipid-binding SYLF domain-containing protein [Nitrospira sp. NS4]|uniref:lipid-binding SYLF domain-containing protein n=1 Tax=Nitrospira sp. NS4 TaxID=3414498 RepID=UPI003C30AEF3